MPEHIHNEDTASIGYGFGQLDYFCEGPNGCGKLFKSIKLEDASDIEKTRIGVLAGSHVSLFGSTPPQQNEDGSWTYANDALLGGDPSTWPEGYTPLTFTNLPDDD